MTIFNSFSEQDTHDIGVKLAKKLKGKEIIAFYGGMGMGKTAFVRGIADYFGLENEVSSPTFAIVNEYKGNVTIYHFDMYRINGIEDLESTGFYDYVDNGIMLIEWSENIESLLPKDIIKIFIEVGENENHRKIFIEGIDIK